MSKYIAVLTVFFVLSGPFQALAAGWKVVSEEKSRIILLGEPVELTLNNARQASSADFSRDRDYQFWTGEDRYFELITTRLNEDTQHWPGYQPWESQLVLWKRLRSGTVTWGPDAVAINNLGISKYRRFLFEKSYCIYIMQIFGAGNENGLPNIMLSGYYCQRDVFGTELPNRLISLIGYRGEAEPFAARK